MRQIAERAGIDNPDQYRRQSNTHRLTTVGSTITQPQTTAGADYNRGWADALNQRLPRNSVLHGQIGRLLVSEEVHRRTHHETSGRLDKRALTRMRAGALDVYTRRDDTPGMDTALLVLIDGSSSMEHPVRGVGGTRMQLAQTAAWHVTRAAESANAKVAVALFTTPSGISKNAQPGHVTGAQITMLKPWSVPVADCALTLANARPTGWTPLSPAIITAAGMLAEVNASRHILMVLTDGECDYGTDGVQTACRLAEGYGVETVGIGMACAEVAAAFPPRYSVNVTDLAQLGAAGLGALVAMLEDANPRGAD